MDDYVTRRCAPRPAPLIQVSMGMADEFLCDGDFGLSVGEGHFPARVIQRVTGSPYVHVIGVHRVEGAWRLVESAPPCVRVRPLAELVSEESGLYDCYRLQPGLCDLGKAWDWAVKAEGKEYSYLELYLVWRRRYREAVQAGRRKKFDFPEFPILPVGPGSVHLREIEREHPWNERGVPDPKPNSDLPDGCRRDCSSLWRAACRVNWIGPPEKLIAAEQEYDCDVAPGDFSIGTKYICTLI